MVVLSFSSVLGRFKLSSREILLFDAFVYSSSAPAQPFTNYVLCRACFFFLHHFHETCKWRFYQEKDKEKKMGKNSLNGRKQTCICKLKSCSVFTVNVDIVEKT